jgi:hypothetical protein
MFRVFLFAGFLLAAMLEAAVAQQPTSAQRDAIRSACRADFMANCLGVQPGGKDALDCLIRNDTKLSASCKSAVEAVKPASAAPAAAVPVAPAKPAAEATPAPAAAEKPAAAQQTAPPAAAAEDQTAVIRKACSMNDFMAHCSWISPSSPEVLLCLKANASDLSSACREALQSVPAPAPAATANPPAEPPHKPAPAAKSPTPPRASMEPSPPPGGAAHKPSAAQLSAIRSACRSDFMADCSGVQPGGAAALQCLQRNAAHLSGGCRSAVAAIGEAAPGTAPASAAAPAATAAPAAAPIGSMPAMRPRDALRILRICGADARALCPGIEPGGGRLLSCLAQNAAGLSPDCRAELSAAAGR